MTIGIDIGSTTTKAVAFLPDGRLCTTRVRASDAIACATGSIGKILEENEIRLEDLERIAVTGVGANKILKDLFGIRTLRIDEISAIGLGGMFLSKRKDVVVTNIGTGSVIIEAKGGSIRHIGGTGVGGGTIVGLAKEMLNITSFASIMELAGRGDLRQVDLLIEDIVDSDISFLKNDATASNFGKMLDTATREDKALGVINMVFEVIGMISVFAARSRGQDLVVVTGNGSDNVIGRKTLGRISEMYGLEFEFPANAEFATAIGAALSASSG